RLDGFAVAAIHFGSTVDDGLRRIDHARIEGIAIGILPVGVFLIGKRVAPTHVIPVIDVKRQRQNIGIIGISGEVAVGLRAGFAALAGVKLQNGRLLVAVLRPRRALHGDAAGN